MASVLHGCARTLVARNRPNPKTVAKWREKGTLEVAPMGPKARHRPTVLADDGVAFTDRPRFRNGPTASLRVRGYPSRLKSDPHRLIPETSTPTSVPFPRPKFGTSVQAESCAPRPHKGRGR